MVINAPWTIFLVLFSFIAESGGKNSDPLPAACAVWALVEIVITARRAKRGDFRKGRAQTACAVVCTCLLVVRPALDLIRLSFPAPHSSACKHRS